MSGNSGSGADAPAGAPVVSPSAPSFEYKGAPASPALLVAPTVPGSPVNPAGVTPAVYLLPTFNSPAAPSAPMAAPVGDVEDSTLRTSQNQGHNGGKGSSSGRGLNSGAQIGVSVVALLVVGVLGFFILRRRRARKESVTQSNTSIFRNLAPGHTFS